MELASLTAGFCVKICHGEAGERFWVLVEKTKGGLVCGTVDNDLMGVDWPYKKKICFSSQCVYQILDPHE